MGDYPCYHHAYYPQASLAERVNRNLKSALKIFHHESQSAWDDLPWLSLAFNTAVHDSTKSAPDKLFGKGIEVSLIGPVGFIPPKCGWYWGSKSVVLDTGL
jgi:hypothetical protein